MVRYYRVRYLCRNNDCGKKWDETRPDLVKCVCGSCGMMTPVFDSMRLFEYTEAEQLDALERAKSEDAKTGKSENEALYYMTLWGTTDSDGD